MLNTQEIAEYAAEMLADANAYSDRYRETGITKYGELARINFGIVRECNAALAAA